MFQLLIDEIKVSPLQCWRSAATRKVTERKVQFESLVILRHSFPINFDTLNTGQFPNNFRNSYIRFVKREQSQLYVF